MMKKIFLLLITFLFCASSGFAHELPRWFTLPVSVYIPSSSYSAPVKSAFLSWQSASGHLIRFSFTSNAKMETRVNVDVMLVDAKPSGSPYRIQARYNSAYNSFNESGYFRRVGITIYTRDADGNKLPSSKVTSIALRAVGEAVGVRSFSYPENSKKKSVMATNYDFDLRSPSGDDIKALKQVYLPNYRLKNLK